MSTLRITCAMIKVGLIESMRRKDIYVVAILTALIILGGWAFQFFGVSGLEVFIKDIAFTSVGILSTVAAVMIAARQIPEELSRKTIYPLLARPVSRVQFLVAKWLCAAFCSMLVFLFMSCTLALVLAALGIHLGPIFWQYLLLKCIGYFWLSGVVVGLSAWMTPSANVTLSLILVFGCGVFNRFILLAKPGISAILFGLIPHYDFFDLGGKATYGWSPIPMWVVAALAAYAMLSASAALTCSWLKFRKQAL